MKLKSITIVGFKSFNKKSELLFPHPMISIVGPNGSGKSNVVEAFRFVLGEQSIKTMRGKKGEDLIFNGGHGSGRSSRASVKIIFNNKERFFSLDSDEVSIERVVYRDGVNEYLLNNEKVRLQDIVELLSKANIGSAGHHIISQGQADMILNASALDRKKLIEGGLALRFLQYRKTESERKIMKTKQNLRESQISRREISAHLKYLSGQVKRMEEIKELSEDLYIKYKKFLKQEDSLILTNEGVLKEKKDIKLKELNGVNDNLNKLDVSSSNTKIEKEIRIKSETKESELSQIQKKKDELNLQIGRLEGEVSAKERMQSHTDSNSVSYSHFKESKKEVMELDEQAKTVNDVNLLKQIIQKLIGIFYNLESTDNQDTPDNSLLKEKIIKLVSERDSFLEEEKELTNEIQTLKRELDSTLTKNRENEQLTIKLISQKNEIEKSLNEIQYEENKLESRKVEFEREVSEGKVLVGERILKYKEEDLEIPESEITYTNQDEYKKELERLKIRLEEKGVSIDESTIKEYDDVKSRDDVLSKDIEDLEGSINSLGEIISKLDKEIQSRFRKGITDINKQFEIFFRMLFGGGRAVLKLVKVNVRNINGDIVMKEGVDIFVSLPQKKINKLEQLSGGERSLISIALMFAISQISPPPFLILDETDAALDEANSKRYGDMIEGLSKKSQLILVTHNRETMSRTGIIYGITLDGQGASKLLSINLEEAVKVAK